MNQRNFKRKGSHKEIACRKGKPIFWDELKERINLSLTPTAIAKLTQIAWVHPNFAKIPECDRQWLSVENDNQLEGRLTVLSKNIFSKSLNS